MGNVILVKGLLSLLNLIVLFIEHFRGKVVCYNLSLLPPGAICLRYRNVISLRQQITDICRGTARIDTATLGEKLLNGLAVTENNNAGWPEFQGEHWAVFLSPFAKSILRKLLRPRVGVSHTFCTFQ